MELGLLGAFIGGVLTLLSPCSVMLLPAFFSYAFATPKTLLSRTGVFYLGLITTLVPLGGLSGTLGAFVAEHRSTFVVASASVVIVLGMIMLLGIPLPTLSRTSTSSDGASAASVYALGTIYGLAGVCAGPLLGAVLTIGALGGNALYGGIIILIFATGMILPLLILAWMWGRVPIIRKLVRPREVRIRAWRNTWTNIIGGALTIGLGVFLLVTEGTSTLNGILGATTQVRLESWVIDATSRFSDIAVVAVVVVLSGGALVVTRARRKGTRGAGPDSD